MFLLQFEDLRLKMIQRNSIWCGNIFQAFGFILFPCSKGCDPPQTSRCAVYPVTHIRAWRHVTTGNNRASLAIYTAGDQSLIHSGCSVSLAFPSPTPFPLLFVRIHLIEASTGTKELTMIYSHIFQNFLPKVPVNHMCNFPRSTRLCF